MKNKGKFVHCLPDYAISTLEASSEFESTSIQTNIDLNTLQVNNQPLRQVRKAIATRPIFCQVKSQPTSADQSANRLGQHLVWNRTKAEGFLTVKNTPWYRSWGYWLLLSNHSAKPAIKNGLFTCNDGQPQTGSYGSQRTAEVMSWGFSSQGEVAWRRETRGVRQQDYPLEKLTHQLQLKVNPWNFRNRRSRRCSWHWATNGKYRSCRLHGRESP